VSLKDLDLRGNGMMAEEQDACAKALTDALKVKKYELIVRSPSPMP
jgi:hypothetical protein